MCYAVPAKIVSIDGDHAIADYGGVTKKVNISLLRGLKMGSYILIHAGFAIEEIDKRKGKEALRTLGDN